MATVFPFSVWDSVGLHSPGLPSGPLHWPPNSSLSPWPSAISNPSFFLPIDNFQTPALSLASGEAFEVPTPSNIWLLTSFFPGFNAHVFFFLTSLCSTAWAPCDVTISWDFTTGTLCVHIPLKRRFFCFRPCVLLFKLETQQKLHPSWGIIERFFF